MKIELEDEVLEKAMMQVLEKLIHKIDDIDIHSNEKNNNATMNKKEAAKYLGISEGLLNKLLQKRKIPCIHPTGEGRGRLVLFRKSSLDQWMTDKEKKSIS